MLLEAPGVPDVSVGALLDMMRDFNPLVIVTEAGGLKNAIGLFLKEHMHRRRIYRAVETIPSRTPRKFRAQPITPAQALLCDEAQVAVVAAARALVVHQRVRVVAVAGTLPTAEAADKPLALAPRSQLLGQRDPWNAPWRTSDFHASSSCWRGPPSLVYL